jgi:hypothetical protein
MAKARGRRRTTVIKDTEVGAKLAYAIQQELEIYSEEVTDAVNQAAEEACKDLVKKTKATAPVKTGDFKRHITYTPINMANGAKRFVWHVKKPDYRLTHLLVHGHVKKNGGRTKGDPFLQNALDQVLPEYEKNVEEAIQK